MTVLLDNLSVGTKEDLGEVSSVVETDWSSNSSKSSVHNSAHSQVVELVVGDIRGYETCVTCCEGVDVIVHLAANTRVASSIEDPRSDMESNVIGTLNMLEAARIGGAERFIFASSGAPLGET